jgi:hypothetical protein
MPLLEAIPQAAQTMKYKLTTLPRGTAKLPIIATPSSLTLKQAQSQVITPQTLNYFGANQVEPSGYTFTISDVRLMSTFEGVGINTPQAQSLNISNTVGTSVSKTVIGTALNLRATTVNTLFGNNSALYASLQIVGNDSGARVSIPVTVTQA